MNPNISDMPHIPHVSIIVPCYKVAEYLPRAAESLQLQTLQSLEVVWVDDGSADETALLCDYAAASSGLQEYVLHVPNGGQSSARNRGIAIANGRTVGFMDPDDVPERSMYEVLYSSAVDTKAVCTVCGFYEEWGYGNPPQIRIPEINHDKQKQSFQQCILESLVTEKLNGCYAWNRIFIKQWLDEHAPAFPEGIAIVEDALFFFSCIPEIKSMTIVPSPLYHYIRRGDSLCGHITMDFLKCYDRKYRAETRLIRKIFPENSADKKKLIEISTLHHIALIINFLKRWGQNQINPMRIWDGCNAVVSNDIWNDIRDLIHCKLCKNPVKYLIVHGNQYLLFAYSLLFHWLPARIVQMMRRVKHILLSILHCK